MSCTECWAIVTHILVLHFTEFDTFWNGAMFHCLFVNTKQNHSKHKTVGAG